MELNCILFPAPSPPTYICENDILGDGKLVFIPMDWKLEEDKEEMKEDGSPAHNRFIRNHKKSQKSFPWYYIPFQSDEEQG